MNGRSQPAHDEEDVALSVFASFCRGTANGNFQQLADRTDLWKLLLRITHQKHIDAVRRRLRLKRGGGEAVHESDAIDHLASTEPPAEMVAILDDTVGKLIGDLRNDVLRDIVLARLDGRSNEQIADQLQISVRSVQRKLRMIEQRWTEELSA